MITHCTGFVSYVENLRGFNLIDSSIIIQIALFAI